MTTCNAHTGIRPADYPELALLLWNGDPMREISREDAFALYERNWRFVEQEAMLPKEVELVDMLKAEFGHGIMLAS